MAIYGMDSDERIFEEDILLRIVKGMTVDWHENFNNSPRIGLTLDPDDTFDIFQGVKGEDNIIYRLYKEFPAGSGKIYYCPHNSGFVKYFSHTGTPNVNEGGFGGAQFGVQLEDETSCTSKVLRGPWSSRATVVNLIVPDERLRIVDVVTQGRYLVGGAIKEAALVFLANHFKFPYHIIREQTEFSHSKQGRKPNVEKAPWTVSLQFDDFVKPGGKTFAHHDYEGIEILYSPE